MHKGFLASAAFLAATAVALGASGAHGLPSVADAKTISIFETAVRYQFYHVFALAVTGIVYPRFSPRLLKIAGIFFIAGIICFCGSLYLFTYDNIAGTHLFSWAGPVTPLGGLLFMAGWVCMGMAVLKNNPT